MISYASPQRLFIWNLSVTVGNQQINFRCTMVFSKKVFLYRKVRSILLQKFSLKTFILWRGLELLPADSQFHQYFQIVILALFNEHSFVKLLLLFENCYYYLEIVVTPSSHGPQYDAFVLSWSKLGNLE